MKEDEVSQSERRRVFENDRITALERRLSTYHAVAQGSIDDERQGRFAAVGKVTVTGAGPTHQYPTQPLTAPSNQMAMMPDEPLIDGTGEGNRLGYAIDRPEGSPSTSQASDVEGKSGGLVTSRSATQQPMRFRRRI
jgi:hypothetical protein